MARHEKKKGSGLPFDYTAGKLTGTADGAGVLEIPLGKYGSSSLSSHGREPQAGTSRIDL